MTAVVGLEAICAVQLVVGVDTHQDEHVAVAIDQQGVRLAERHAPAGSYGYRELERWSQKLGEVRAFGVEGTGSYGAGLARSRSAVGTRLDERHRHQGRHGPPQQRGRVHEPRFWTHATPQSGTTPCPCVTASRSGS